MPRTISSRSRSFFLKSGRPFLRSQIPQPMSAIPPIASDISRRELASFSHHANFQNAGSTTIAGGADVIVILGGNGVGARQ